VKETPLPDIETYIDTLVDDVANGKISAEECIARCTACCPDMVPPLQLALVLRDVEFDAGELEGVRVRVWNRLEALLDQEEPVTAPIPRIHRQNTHPLRPRRSTWRIAALCAAVLMLALIGSWTLSIVAVHALPDSPLYAIKRLDENVQLHLTWSSSQQAQVLAMIAQHRLDEARAEASKHNTAQALSLMSECNTATHQLISLVITLRAQHQDTTVATTALALTLHAEYDALQQAQDQGQTTLAQAVLSNIQSQQTTLSTSNIAIPSVTTQDPGTPPAAATATWTDDDSTPQAHPTTGAHPTPSPPGPQVTPGANGNGSGAGEGNGGGNGGGHGGGKGLGSEKRSAP
jgi:uncharacterized membrane protein YgcG